MSDFLDSWLLNLNGESTTLAKRVGGAKTPLYPSIFGLIGYIGMSLCPILSLSFRAGRGISAVLVDFNFGDSSHGSE
jgi:hypothetical protein